jgi:hypothetical protein
MGSDTNGINARTMRFVARDRLVSRRYVRPWKSLHNGQQSIATRARMNSNKGLEKRRQRGLATSVPFLAGLWRSLAKETEAREMAAHKLAAE